MHQLRISIHGYDFGFDICTACILKFPMIDKIKEQYELRNIKFPLAY